MLPGQPPHDIQNDSGSGPVVGPLGDSMGLTPPLSQSLVGPFLGHSF